jgi:hypothetical protein
MSAATALVIGRGMKLAPTRACQSRAGLSGAGIFFIT